MIIDPQVTDLLEEFGASPWEGSVWRHVFGGRDPTIPTHRAGRWAPEGEFAVLYSSLVRDGAIAEADFVISQFSLPPSTKRRVCRLDIKLQSVIDLRVNDRLAFLGIDGDSHQEQWSRCQEIGAAANFMGFDGILVPSARFSGDNLVILTENMGEGSFVEAGDEDGIT